MTGLAERQAAFLNAVRDDDQPLPDGWRAEHTAGLSVYRNNYRATLIDTMRATFDRTARLVGADAFHQAAAHHVILHPPAGWTLDDVGEGFDRTCAELFVDDPEVPELAWLEWAMHRAFTAHDAIPLTAQTFAQSCAGFVAEDWANLRLTFVPGLTLAPVRHDLVALWRTLAHDDDIAAIETLPTPHHVVVWRDGEEPVFSLVPDMDGQTLSLLANGARWDAACDQLEALIGAEGAAAEAGRLLAWWIEQGLIAAIRTG